MLKYQCHPALISARLYLYAPDGFISSLLLLSLGRNKMSLTEPRIFKIYFYDELYPCGKTAEEVKRALGLEPGDKDPTTLLQDFLGQAVPTSDGLWDTPCEFADTTSSYRLKARYYQRVGAGFKTAPADDPIDKMFVLAVALNSNSPEVIKGWQGLERRLPTHLPNGPLGPVTIYYAVSDKEVTAQKVIKLAQPLFPDVSPTDLCGGMKKTQLLCGSLYQFGAMEKYFLFSSKKKESEASRFATLSLPLLRLYLHFGDVMAQDKEGRVPAARNHMKGVSERIKSKLDDYSSRGFGSITSEAERADVFEITKDLWLLNHDTSQMLNLVRTVDIALSNFRDLKGQLLSPDQTDEIFCQKERLLELQKAQLQAQATHLHNTFESGRVVLDSIEDHMELEYTRELKESNKKALSLQSAAFLIEFAIVFYYFLGSWHYILGEKFYAFPALARLGCATTMATLICTGTHLFARWRLTRDRNYLYGLLGLLFLFLLTLGYIVRYALMLDKFRH